MFGGWKASVLTLFVGVLGIVLLVALAAWAGESFNYILRLVGGIDQTLVDAGASRAALETAGVTEGVLTLCAALVALGVLTIPGLIGWMVFWGVLLRLGVIHSMAVVALYAWAARNPESLAERIAELREALVSTDFLPNAVETFVHLSPALPKAMLVLGIAWAILLALVLLYSISKGR